MPPHLSQYSEPPPLPHAVGHSETQPPMNLQPPPPMEYVHAYSTPVVSRKPRCEGDNERPRKKSKRSKQNNKYRDPNSGPRVVQHTPTQEWAPPTEDIDSDTEFRKENAAEEESVAPDHVPSNVQDHPLVAIFTQERDFDDGIQENPVELDGSDAHDDNSTISSAESEDFERV